MFQINLHSGGPPPAGTLQQEPFDNIQPDIDDLAAEEMLIPRLLNEENNVNYDSLTYEEKFCIEILKIKAMVSINFFSLLLVFATILTFLKYLLEIGVLTIQVLDRLIILAKSKNTITQIGLKLGNGIGLFKEVLLRIKPRDLPEFDSKAYVLNLELALSKYLSNEENVRRLFEAKYKPLDQSIIDSIRQTCGFEESESECNLFLQI